METASITILWAGNSMDDVISGYRTLTGKSQIMPKWAMGSGKAGTLQNPGRITGNPC
jgi:alpha-glucosidase (family GH31 glycosyl hydrolase)